MFHSPILPILSNQFREHGLHPLRRTGTATTSLVRLKSLGIPVEEQLAKINSCLNEIDQIFLPSTINNFMNLRYISKIEREIISVFEEAEPKALNYLVTHVKLGLVFYKVKDHRSFGGQHRTELIELLAVDRLSVLTVLSRVVVLHALQMMKLPANARAESWVRNIILKTHQDDLSELKVGIVDCLFLLYFCGRIDSLFMSPGASGPSPQRFPCFPP